MTRAEAKKEVSRWMPKGTPLSVARADIQQVVINKIYNDFESRTCENCANCETHFLYQNICSLLEGMSEHYMGHFVPDKGFCCNKWQKTKPHK